MPMQSACEAMPALFSECKCATSHYNAATQLMRSRFARWGWVLLLSTPALLHAQSADSPAGQKHATAVHISDGAIRLDGRLDDAAWTDAPALVDFVQKEPLEGAPATQRMEVRFAYDNGAV